MSEFIDREEAIANIKAAYCCGCNDYNGVKCRACQLMDAMDVLEDEPAMNPEHLRRAGMIDAESLVKYLTDWKDGLTGSYSLEYSYAIRAKQTLDVLDTVLTRIDYMLKENDEVPSDGNT